MRQTAEGSAANSVCPLPRGDAKGAGAAPNARRERANRRRGRRPCRARTTKVEHCEACRSSGHRRI